MGALPTLHRAVDALAMWTEDRLARAPQRYSPGPEGPLGCWGPLGPLPAPPAGPGLWSAPSPLASGPSDRMVVRVHQAAPAAVPRGVALLVPPWKTRDAGLLSGWVRLLAAGGWESWLLSPPHHLERTRQGARSGEGFVTLDLVRLRRVFEQLVLELRLLAALAGARGPVGILGLSLGALGAALAATGGEPLAFAALVAPADLHAVLARTRIGRRYRELALRAGTPLPEARAMADSLAAFSPALRRPATDRIFVAAGGHDLIVPPEGPLALARAWGVEPTVYARGHITLLFACRALRRDLAAFLGAG